MSDPVDTFMGFCKKAIGQMETTYAKNQNPNLAALNSDDPEIRMGAAIVTLDLNAKYPFPVQPTALPRLQAALTDEKDFLVRHVLEIVIQNWKERFNVE